MKRFVMSAALLVAAAAAPAHAGPEVVRCGITPRIPCGVCVVDDTTGDRTCVTPEVSG